MSQRTVGRRSRTIARALAWMDQVRAGISVAAIARTEGVSERFIRARLRPRLLSPQIVAAIEQGRQPASPSTELLVRTPLPSDRDKQARLLGFESSLTHFAEAALQQIASSIASRR